MPSCVRPVRFWITIATVWCVSVWTLMAVPQAQAQVKVYKGDEAEIKRAVEKGQEYLLTHLVHEDDPTCALAVIALLKSGIKPSDQRITTVCDRLAKHCTTSAFLPTKHHIYEAGVTLLALANADPRKYRGQINTIAQYLITHQGKFGQWHYPHDETGDTSITQYAMLGLWEAARLGISIPAEVWDKSANWHLKTQSLNGGFAYHSIARAGDGMALHSMTAAGVGSLRISRRYLFTGARTKTIEDPAQPNAPPQPKKNRSGKRFGILEPVFREEGGDEVGAEGNLEHRNFRNASYTPMVRQEDLDAGVDKGVGWLTKNFTVTKPTGYPIYYLYGLERASALADVTQYGDHDWYSEGVAHLVSTQGMTGEWQDQSGMTTGTAFGVLFLVRATSKMVKPDVPRVEFGTGTLVGGRGLPSDLKASQLDDGKVKVKQKKSDLEELLAQLENPQIPLLESTQAEIVEQVVIGDRKKLIGQVDRLKKLAKHPDPEVRRTALWALGRSDDLRLAPILIAALQDDNADVFVEARNALRCLSRRVEDFGTKEEPVDAKSRERERQKWLTWYKQIRDYDQRDLLNGPGE